MMKIGVLINWDVEVVALSEAVQNTFKTIKLSIFGHISSLPWSFSLVPPLAL